MADRKDYEVGYRKPPVHTRFQKGQSGNPSGRPKGSINVATALEKELNTPVTIKENGRTRTITKLQAAIKQLVNKAAGGDPRALHLLLNLKALSAGEAAEEAPSPLRQEADHQVLASLLKRFGASTPIKETSHEPE